MNTFGETLRLSRRSAGLTGVALASQADITQATISRYESGDRSPRPEDIDAIAEAVKVSPDFLTHGGTLRGAIAAEAHMRRKATAKVADWKRAEALTNFLRLQLSNLLEPFDITPSLYLPVFDPSADDPKDAAASVRDQWNMPIGPVDNLCQWLEAAGVIVIEMDLGTTRIDGLSQRIGEYPLVVLSSRAPTDRKRLTLAHELGHLVMHTDYASLEAEQEASIFAAEFLMPAPAIRPALHNLTASRLFDLKRSWMVSAQTILERAHGLGKVSSAEKAAIYKTFAKRGWRIKEPFSQELPTDQPQFLQHIFAELRTAGLTDEDIAERAKVPLSNEMSVVNLTGRPRLRAVS